MTEATFDSLLDLRRRFLALIERRVEDRAIAEDILQAAYVRALESQALESKGRLRADESAVALVLSHPAQRGDRSLSPPHNGKAPRSNAGQRNWSRLPRLNRNWNRQLANASPALLK